MKPILYYDDVSPPVRSVLLLISALDIDVEFKLVSLFKREHLDEAYLKINPLHTVPALAHDGLVLTDSHAILVYLCDIFGGEPQFSMTNPKTRATIINRLFFNSSILFKRDSDVMREIFHRQLADLSGHLDKLDEAYGFLEIFLAQNKFIATDELTVADFSIVATLSTLDLLLKVESGKWPRLSEWFVAMKQLPYYGTANQIGLEKLKLKLQQYSKLNI